MRPLRREQVWSQTSRGTGLIYRRKDWVQLGTGKEACAGDMRGHKRVMCGSGWAGAQNAAHCAREISREASHGIAARKRCSHKPRSTLLIKTRTGARGHPWVPDSVFTVYADTPCSPPICLHFPHHVARTFYPLFHWCQWCLVHSRFLNISVHPLHHNTVLKPIPITPFNGHLTYPSDSHRALCVYDHTCSTWPSRHNDTELQWLD
jgi:hypothetical protein